MAADRRYLRALSWRRLPRPLQRTAGNLLLDPAAYLPPILQRLCRDGGFHGQSPNFGATFDGVDASAAIPEVRFCCAAKVLPVLQAGYPIRSASQYDWTSYEPEDTTSHSAVWQEQLAIGDTPSRVAVGINHAGQAHNDLLSLLAGTLLGLGGATLLSAVQETLHARD